MVFSPCGINDRDSDMPVFRHKTDHFSRVIKEVMMAFYSGVEEVKTVEDMIKSDCKVIVLMRGLPGSGKSTLARYLMETLADTNVTKEKHVFSADDYFMDPKNNRYVFNRKFLREAHSWNVEAVLAAAQKSVRPIIVDNTNLTVSEMWPYACIAAKYDYMVRYLEPSTHWRYNIHECAKRNLHGVPEKHIGRMMGRFDRSVSESELLSLVSSQTNFQNCCDTDISSKRAIARYRQRENYAENRCTRQLRSICIYSEKISNPSCTHSGNCSPDLLELLLSPPNILTALGTSSLPVARQSVLTSLLSSSEFTKPLFSEEVLTIDKRCNIRNEDRTCATVSLQNNVLNFYDQTFKFISFLHLFVCARNVGICAAQFMSMKEMYNRMSLEKYLPLATFDSLDSYSCISRGNKLRVIVDVDHGVQPSVNINNIKTVVFPINVRSLFLPAPKNIFGSKGPFQVRNRNKKNKESQSPYAETAENFPSLTKICNIEEQSAYQTNSKDLEDANNIHCSWDVCDSSDSWNASDNVNYDPWDACSSSSGITSWDVRGNGSWETETVTSSESSCVLPKPQRTDRKARTARYSREQKLVKIERAPEEETNCSLPKQRLTNTRPRVMQYSSEKYVFKAKPKIPLSPELEAWNSVENPNASWERKQSTENRNESTARGLRKSQNTSCVSRNISMKNRAVLPATANKETLTSKPQREKRTRNHQ